MRPHPSNNPCTKRLVTPSLERVLARVGFASLLVGCLLALSCGGNGLGSSPGSLVSNGLSATPSSVDFGDVRVGGNSALATIVTNSGTDSVTISSVMATGEGFTTSGPKVPFTLAAGQAVSIGTAFSPSSSGTADGTLSVTGSFDQQSSPAKQSTNLTIKLRGKGVAASLVATPPSVSFGDVAVGSNSTAQVQLILSLPKSGKSSSVGVTVSGASVSGNGFSIPNSPFPITLVGSETANVSVEFAPQAPGTSSGSMSLQSDASNSVLVVSLSGNGVATTHSVGLAWDPPAPVSGVALDGYNIYRGDASSSLACAGITFSQVGSTSGASSAAFTDNSVLGGHTYCYQVTAMANNTTTSAASESSPSNVVQAAVPSP